MEILTENRILNMAVRAGKILLENGAEISRIEETMDRIISSYSITGYDFYVLSNGIFLTGDSQGIPYAKVGHIPVKTTRLDKLIEVNSLSRRIVSGSLRDLDDIDRELDRIENLESFSLPVRLICAALGSGAFAYIMGGSIADSLVSLVGGLAVYVLLLLSEKLSLSKIISVLFPVTIGIFICFLTYHLGIGDKIYSIIAGAIVPLIPGVSFINAVRDIGNADYLSGSIRMLDAILTLLCIAMGVAFALGGYYLIFGGGLL